MHAVLDAKAHGLLSTAADRPPGQTARRPRYAGGRNDACMSNGLLAYCRCNKYFCSWCNTKYTYSTLQLHPELEAGDNFYYAQRQFRPK